MSAEDSIIAKYVIKYDGLACEEHVIDLSAFGTSLQGLGDTLSIAGTYVLTGQIPVKASDYKVKVYTDAKIQAKSIDVYAFVQGLQQAVGTITGIKEIFNSILSFLFSKMDKNDSDTARLAIEKLSWLAEQSDKARHSETEKVLDILRVLTQASNKKALSPVGSQCSELKLIDSAETVFNADQAVKAAVSKSIPQSVSKLSEYDVYLYELNKLNCSCKLCKQEDYDENFDNPKTYPGKIVDENFKSQNGNPYLDAFASGKLLHIVAKEITSKSGAVSYSISDAYLDE